MMSVLVTIVMADRRFATSRFRKSPFISNRSTRHAISFGDTYLSRRKEGILSILSPVLTCAKISSDGLLPTFWCIMFPSGSGSISYFQQPNVFYGIPKHTNKIGQSIIVLLQHIIAIILHMTLYIRILSPDQTCRRSIKTHFSKQILTSNPYRFKDLVRVIISFFFAAILTANCRNQFFPLALRDKLFLRILR